MGDVLTVRDHSRPCEHGSLWPHWDNAAKARWWHEPDCLGGREMRLRRRDDGLWAEIEDDGDEHG